jgi:hypothetical protein
VAVHAQPLITDRWCLRACRQLNELLRLDRVDSNGLGSKDSPPWQWPIYNVVTDSLVSSPPWDVALEDINLALLLHVFRQTRLFRSTARDVVLVWSDLGTFSLSFCRFTGTYEFTAAMRPPGISVAIFAIVSCISVQDRETARGPGSRYRPRTSNHSDANPCVPSPSLRPLFSITGFATCRIRRHTTYPPTRSRIRPLGTFLHACAHTTIASRSLGAHITSSLAPIPLSCSFAP